MAKKLQRSWCWCNAESECNAVNETERGKSKERRQIQKKVVFFCAV
jgi:hypothetical protein